MKHKSWPVEDILKTIVLVIVAVTIIVGCMLEYFPAEEQDQMGGYSTTVERSGIAGDASFSVTLYEPGGGAVLRLDADNVSGTADAPIYQYGFTWLDEVELTITEVWRQ